MLLVTLKFQNKGLKRSQLYLKGVIQTVLISKMQMWKPTEKDKHWSAENATHLTLECPTLKQQQCSRKFSCRKCTGKDDSHDAVTIPSAYCVLLLCVLLLCLGEVFQKVHKGSVTNLTTCVLLYVFSFHLKLKMSIDIVNLNNTASFQYFFKIKES